MSVPARRGVSFLVLIMVASSLLAAGSSVAQGKPVTVYTRFTDEDVTRFLQEDGFQFTPRGSGGFQVVLSGRKCGLVNRETNLLISTYMKGAVPLDRINEWNIKYRFSHAYVDDEGDTAVEADLSLEGGITKERFTSYIKTFQMTVSAFSEFVKK